MIAARPGLGIDVLPRADRSEMFRWLARLEPSGVPLEEVLAGLRGREDLRGIQTLVIAFPIWGGGSVLAGRGDPPAGAPRPRVVVRPGRAGRGRGRPRGPKR